MAGNGNNGQRKSMEAIIESEINNGVIGMTAKAKQRSWRNQ